MSEPLARLPRLIAARDWPAAERLLRAQARKKGAPASVFYNLAKVLEADGRAAQAGPWLAKAVAAEPRHQAAWYELGRHRLAAGELAGAEAAFARASALDPADADARRSLARVGLRLGHWEKAARALGADTDGEARVMRYRIAAETGHDARADLAALLAEPSLRPAALKAMTRTARGRIPLRLA